MASSRQRPCLAVPLTSATEAAPAPTPAGPARLSVTVHISRFTEHGRLETAAANAVASLTSTQGTRTTGREPIALTAATSGGCQVLHLYLQQLDLNLLGLVATLDKVNLNVIGHANGGVLGQLFCRLSKGVTGKIARASDESKLNAKLRAHPAVLHFTAYLKPVQETATTSQAAAPSCQVLDLVLGPLDLNLLGLEVDLNQIHLNVTANPNGGVLGSLFCQLASAHVTT